MQVTELMTNAVLTIRADTPLEQAATEMRLGHVRHLPVVDLDGRVLGVLSSFDVMRALAQGNGRTQVRDVMSTQVVTVRDDTSASAAARQMRELKIGSLPVVDADGRLAGIITETDFLEVAELALAGKPLRRRHG
ncbi:MAG: CBS domain-containing protein [Myxococcaceae bacterium]|nr:CBS domain-containing protein [Myxococcaceae bacterium]